MKLKVNILLTQPENYKEAIDPIRIVIAYMLLEL